MKFSWPMPKELWDSIPERFKAKYWILLIERRFWLQKTLLALLLFSLLSFGIGYWYMYGYSGCFFNIGCLTDDKGNPLDLDKLGKADFKKASYVYAGNGEEIGKYFEEIRDPVKLSEVPKIIQQAFLAAEDKRFYNHSGIDIIAIGSAATGNTLRSYDINIWKRSGGASTITQQLARLLYNEEVHDFNVRSHTLSRKIKEARLAIQLEKRYSKDKIFAGFLSMIWLGHGANGVSPAAKRYFGKDIRRDKFNVREAAILAALNKHSKNYDPIFHKEEEEATKEIVRLATAKDRYNFVLEQMVATGAISKRALPAFKFQKDIDPKTEQLAYLRSWLDSDYGYSNRLVKEMLLTRGYSDKDLLYGGGFRIYTTLDPAIQKIVSEEFEKHLALLNKEKTVKDKINGAFVVIEVKTGKILALSGGNDFNESQYNRVMASRSPGSGFKPFNSPKSHR